jgi:hypothetical protein
MGFNSGLKGLMCLPVNRRNLVKLESLTYSHFEILFNCGYTFSSYKAFSNFLFRLLHSLLLMKKHNLLNAYDVLGFEFRKSVHHHTIQIIQPTSCNIFTSLLFDVYVWLNMFRASSRPSSGAYNCTRSLWFNRWTAAAGVLLVVACQTTTNKVPAASLQR